MKLCVITLAALAAVAFGNFQRMARGGRICTNVQGWKKEVCYSRLACMYMNQLRRQRGLPSMKLGTKSMLRNAIQHSKVQFRRNNLFHQNLRRGIIVGKGQCKTTLSAENVAMFQDYRVKNPAAQCTEQWRTSPGHMRNMMSRTSKICAVGIWQDKGGSWWCTQTFSWNTPKKNCQMGAGDSPVNKPPARKPPTRKPPTRKPPSRKPPARKPPTRKPPNRKPPNRKPRGRKPRGRKPRGRKPRGRKPRGRKPRMCLRAKRIKVWRLRGKPTSVVQVCRYHRYKCKCRFCVYRGRRKSCFSEGMSRYLDRVISKFFW